MFWENRVQKYEKTAMEQSCDGSAWLCMAGFRACGMMEDASSVFYWFARE